MIKSKRGANLYKHGMSWSAKGERSPEYRTWLNIRARCNIKTHPRYASYGGRGIKVCKRWNDFTKFLEDMGKKPKGKYSIERIDNNGNYNPSNCKWSTCIEQNNNRKLRDGIPKLAAEFMIKNGHKSVMWGDNLLIHEIANYVGIESNGPATVRKLFRALREKKSAKELFDFQLVPLQGCRKPVSIFTVKSKTLEGIDNIMMKVTKE